MIKEEFDAHLNMLGFIYTEDNYFELIANKTEIHYLQNVPMIIVFGKHMLEIKSKQYETHLNLLIEEIRKAHGHCRDT